MLSIKIIFLLTVLHLFADIALQPEGMSTIKYKYRHVLVLHCLIYTIPFAIFFHNLPFLSAIFSSHFIIDLLSSKASHYFYKKVKLRRCADVICIDQALHYTVLFILYYLFC